MKLVIELVAIVRFSYLYYSILLMINITTIKVENLN